MHKSPKSFQLFSDSPSSRAVLAIFATATILMLSGPAAAQDTSSPEYNTPWYRSPFAIITAILVLALVAQFIYWRKKKAADKNPSNRLSITGSSDVQFGLKQPIKKKSGRLTKEEMSSLLKASATPAPGFESDSAGDDEPLPPTPEPIPEVPATPEVPVFVAPAATAPIETGPIISVEALSPAPEVSPIEDFTDDDVFLDALDQLQDEDPEARVLAVRVLGQFVSRNAVSALSFAAGNDPESSVRAAAVASLGILGHESVFPTVLSACADPAADVRLAAARTLADLKFSRAEAYSRMIDEGDPEMLRKAVAACQQTGMTARAFDRLASPDSRQSYEAFAILSLLVKAGETKPLFNAIAQHPAENIRLAAVKLLRNSKLPGIFGQMSIMADASALTPRVRAALMDDSKPAKRGPLVTGTSRPDIPRGPFAPPEQPTPPRGPEVATPSAAEAMPSSETFAPPPVQTYADPPVFTSNDEVIDTRPRTEGSAPPSPPPVFRDDPFDR
jgi:hypothetical protein